PQDPRDRLRAEFAFSRLAWDHGVRRLPQPLAADRARRLGLYEFVEGRKLAPGEVGADAVSQALAFVEEVNRDKAAADSGIVASEACFTLGGHLATVTRRLGRLDGIDADSPAHIQACRFVEAELRPCWRAVERQVLEAAGRLGLDPDEPLAEADRCLSPSDFGFHNAIVPDQGVIRFIDFEYAGWDDPAKLVCDFFNQIAVPVPRGHYPAFADAVAAGLSRPDLHRRRFDLLMPVYTVKWATIALNDFLPVGASRRRFALGEADASARLQAQLDKARRCLTSLGEAAHAGH
ncbi:MAG TPA: phosphotransferase, partial [Solirubrobacterales bacterium]|nr:phosphotransferase [Solirubrobacterales bacterium]